MAIEADQRSRRIALEQRSEVADVAERRPRERRLERAADRKQCVGVDHVPQQVGGDHQPGGQCGDGDGAEAFTVLAAPRPQPERRDDRHGDERGVEAGEDQGRGGQAEHEPGARTIERAGDDKPAQQRERRQHQSRLHAVGVRPERPVQGHLAFEGVDLVGLADPDGPHRGQRERVDTDGDDDERPRQLALHRDAGLGEHDDRDDEQRERSEQGDPQLRGIAGADEVTDLGGSASVPCHKGWKPLVGCAPSKLTSPWTPQFSATSR